MKRILLGTTLLALASLCGQPAHAAITYAAGASSITPANGASYTVWPPAYTVNISIAVTNLYVEVNGATPSSNITLGWQLIASEGTARQFQSGNLDAIATDVTTPTATVMTDASGHYRESVDGSVGKDYSPGNGYVVDVYGVIKDASHNTKATVDVTNTYQILEGV